MKMHLTACFHTPMTPTPYILFKKVVEKRILFTLLCLLFSLLAACNSDTSSISSTSISSVPVNGFGVAANHGHGLLALPNNVLVLATHFGLFRSSDDGTTWLEVAAGLNQPMSGLMTTSLVSSPLNPKRLYVITLPAAQNAKATLGLYTSVDEGKTWNITISTKKVGSMYFVVPGNNSAEEIYIYVPNEGSQGLKVSHDAGQHFANTGTLPFSILGLFVVPGAPGQLIAYGDNGMARSSDAGSHWQILAGTTNGIFGMSTAGPHDPIYATGDAGIYASNDGGKIFKLVYTQASLNSLTVSPSQVNLLYGKTGQKIFHSTNGGRTWTTLPPIEGNQQNLADLAVDPHNTSVLYLSLSYPMQVYRFNQNSGQWTSLTPKV